MTAKPSNKMNYVVTVIDKNIAKKLTVLASVNALSGWFLAAGYEDQAKQVHEKKFDAGEIEIIAKWPEGGIYVRAINKDFCD